MKKLKAQAQDEHNYKIAANLDRLKAQTALAEAGDIAANEWYVNHFAHYIKFASEGSSGYAKWVLNMFCCTVRNHRKNNITPTKFNEDLLDYVEDAFKKILDGVSPSKALGIGKDTGRPPIDPDEKINRDIVICDTVLRLKQSGRYDSYEKAKAQAAQELKLGRATINAGWKNETAKELAKEFPGLIQGWSMQAVLGN